MPKLAKLKVIPDWHAQAIGEIKANFDQIHKTFFDAARRAVWLGIYLHHIKEKGKADKSIPHGQFRPWLKQNLPDISLSSIAVYMTIGKGVLDSANLPFSKIQKLDFWAPGHLPEKVEKLIAGKNQQALFLEFKQAEEIEEGVLAPKRGRRKGEGGNSAEHLARIKAAEEKARIEALQLSTADDIAPWLLKNSDDNGIALMDAAHWRKLKEAVAYAHHYITRHEKKGSL